MSRFFYGTCLQPLSLVRKRMTCVCPSYKISTNLNLKIVSVHGNEMIMKITAIAAVIRLVLPTVLDSRGKKSIHGGFCHQVSAHVLGHFPVPRIFSENVAAVKKAKLNNCDQTEDHLRKQIKSSKVASETFPGKRACLFLEAGSPSSRPLPPLLVVLYP